jgi:hypothetical protein
MSDDDLCENCGHPRASHGIDGGALCADGQCGCSRFFEAEEVPD